MELHLLPILLTLLELFDIIPSEYMQCQEIPRSRRGSEVSAWGIYGEKLKSLKGRKKGKMKREGMILWALFSTLCLLTLSPTTSFSQDKSSILFNWKDWGKCSEQERDSLQSRWTDEKIQKVVRALKTGTQLPDYVTKIGGRNSSAGYDLRGIRLTDQDLDSVVLRHAFLDGAIFTNSHLILAVFDSTSLDYAILRGTNLQGADLQNANLDGAFLGYANLKGAHLERANFQEANLWYANLQGANLQETDLQGAKLWHANLQGAILRHTFLKEADLFTVRFDTTDLWLTKLGEAQNIRDIVWGDSLHDRYLIYGEILGETQTNASDREVTFRHAEDTYRDLKSLYKNEGMGKVANKFNFRENEVETKRYHRYHYMWILRYFFLNLTYGYGSKPFRLFWCSLFIIVVFALLFIFQTLIPKSGLYLAQGSGETYKKLNWTQRKGWMFLDCLFYSALALCTFGYGAFQLRKWMEYLKLKPLELTPIRWTRFLVFIEAGLGIYLFALLTIVLFGRG